MNIIVAETAGFCFGVRKAIRAAEEVAGEGTKPVHTYGPLIHNQDAIRDLEQKGIQALSEGEPVPEGATVVIRAHGVGQQVEEAIRRRAGKVVDATCPFVIKIHQIAAASKGPVLVMGDRHHPEVAGILGWCRGSVQTVGSLEELQAMDREGALDKTSCMDVVEQTTFDRFEYERMIEFLRQNGYNMNIHATICPSTIRHQEEAARLSSKVDMMLVIGGRHSSNTHKLYKLCQERCPRTYLIENVSELDPAWLTSEVENVGVTAGASTPDHVTGAVVRALQAFSRDC